MQIANTSVPIVVLKAEEYGALGVARSLGRLGIQLYAVTANPRASALNSRYWSGKFIWDVGRAAAEDTVGFLLELARKINQRPVLIPIGDASSVLVADYAEALKGYFLFPRVPRELVRSLVDKKQMYFLCKKLGFSTAETAFPQSKEEVLNFMATATFPVVLKGINTWRAQQPARTGVVIIEDRDELLKNYEQVGDPEHPDVMLQEYISGADDSVWMFNGYFNDCSDCLFGLTGKKMRQYPAYRGATTLGVCLKNEIVEKTAKEFMKVVGYKGILDVDLRYDARLGQYKILDVNPRLGATFRLFVASNGMDVARALYLDLIGQPVPPAVLLGGRKWLVEDKDLVSSLHYHRDGKLTLRQWAYSFRGIKEAAYFAWDDPVPFLRLMGNFFRQFYRWVRKKIV